MVFNWKKNEKSLWEWRIILWKPPPHPCKLPPKKKELGLGLIIHLNGSNFKAWWVCTGNESVILAKPQILNLRFGALLWCGMLKGQVCIDICKQFVWGSPHAIVLHECFMFLCTKEPFSLNSIPNFYLGWLALPLMTPLPPGILEWFITQSCFKWQRMSALPRELCPKQEPF